MLTKAIFWGYSKSLVIACHQTNQAGLKPSQQITIPNGEFHSTFIKGAVYGFSTGMMQGEV
jgi:hypothetical protein